MIGYKEVSDRYSYDPETGQIISRKSGKHVGSRSRNRGTSYLLLTILGHSFRCHRIAWLLYYGEWPDGQVDHRDGNGLNNRIDNLRVATHSQNQRNQRINSRNTSGVKGVSWHSATKSWQAMIWIDGKRKFLGRFKRLKHAASARALAAAANGYDR